MLERSIVDEKRKLSESEEWSREQGAKARVALVEAAEAKPRRDYTVGGLCDARCVVRLAS